MAAVRAVHALVERMLARDGPLPALCEEQRSLAGIVAEALDAPPRDEALVTLIQAATGTGKTVALLAPVMALAALQRRQGVRACCFSLSLVRSPQELPALFRRRIAWDDGAIGGPAGAVAVAVLMNCCCRSGEDVGAKAPSVGKGWASAQRLSRPCPRVP